MHIERERENIKLRRLTAAAGQQHNPGQPSSSFKSVSLQPPSQPTVPARRPSLQTQPAASNPPKRDLKLTVSHSSFENAMKFFYDFISFF